MSDTMQFSYYIDYIPEGGFIIEIYSYGKSYYPKTEDSDGSNPGV